MMHPPIARSMTGPGALLATAIHAGSAIRPSLLPYCALSAAERLREEDPFTDRLATMSDTHVVGSYSRFEVDLNRPRHKAVYEAPADAWGLQVWRNTLPPAEVEASLQAYDRFYALLSDSVEGMLARHSIVVVYDIHSYNHQREGPGCYEPTDTAPEVNLGTAWLDRERWAPVIQALADGLRAGGTPDVRENVRFKGGHMVQWLSQRYGGRVCPIAIEFKKTFMDEWTGVPFPGAIEARRRALAATVAPVLAAARKVDQHG